MELLKNCPNCGNGNFKHFKTCVDFTVSKERFEIVFCTICGLKFTNPRPSASEIGVYYDSPDYISHSNENKGLINKIYQKIRSVSLKRKISWLTGLQLKGKKLLDIGCGTGEFLNEAKNAGFDVIGIEPNEKARSMGVTNYQLNVFEESYLNTLPTETFDLITMWHVLEHVHDLQSRVGQIQKLLKQDGFAAIAVPNYTSWDAQFYGSEWAAYDVPRHLYHFSPDVIKSMFVKTGMKHVKSLPMKFDSYYVSLLSSKYKGSFIPVINGFLCGLKSNLHAKNDPERYSSVVYVFQKTI